MYLFFFSIKKIHNYKFIHLSLLKSKIRIYKLPKYYLLISNSKKVPFISFHIKVPFKLPSLRPCKIYAKFRTGDSSLFFWENSLTKKALRQILKKVILLKNSIAYFLPIKQFRFPTAHTKQKQEEKPQSLSSCQTRCIRMSFLLFPPAGLLLWPERRFSPHGRNR